jgi:hypothetical protein
MTSIRKLTVLGAAMATFMLPAERAAWAQTSGWHVDVAPLYFWGASTSGNIAVNGTKNIPVYLDFSDAAKNLAGAFMFRGEARTGQWGMLGDVFFIRLSTDVNYKSPVLSVPISGTLKMDETIFNGKVTYEVKSGGRFYLVGGVRTLTMAPTVHFIGPAGGQLADIDISRTVAAAVGGFIYRPKLGDKVVLLMQADIGGGSAFTVSATGGIEFLIKPWLGVAAGYNVLRIDTGSVPTSGTGPVNVVETEVTQGGPVFTLTFHWAEK